MGPLIRVSNLYISLLEVELQLRLLPINFLRNYPDSLKMTKDSSLQLRLLPQLTFSAIALSKKE